MSQGSSDRAQEFLAKAASVVSADVLSTDPDLLDSYGCDWTKNYAPAPLAVARPRTLDEVCALLPLCGEFDMAVVPSGGRTGLSGGAVAANGELVLSLDRMNKIGPVNAAALTVRVEAGAITKSVHEKSLEHGLTWPVDFASAGSSTIGGNIATNAGGVHVVRYGSTRQWVIGIQAVTMDGTVLELNNDLEKNNTGFDLRQLLIGSEGTLAVITAATLKLAVHQPHRAVAFLAVPTVEAALELLESVRAEPGHDLHAFEFLTAACLKEVVSLRGRPVPIGTRSDIYVLVELAAGAPGTAQNQLEQWIADEVERDRVIDGAVSQSDRQAQELWFLREEISASLSENRIVHKNDVSVPVRSVPEFHADVTRVLEGAHPDFELFLFGHIGDGNLHINVRMPESMDPAEFFQRCHEVDASTYELVQRYGGSVSAEHGIGLLKKHALHYSRSPKELEVFRAIKRAFDPKLLLNPGKIFD